MELRFGKYLSGIISFLIDSSGRVSVLKGVKFIIVGSEKWISGNQTSKHHLVRQFIALGASVLYLENISMRKLGSGGGSDVGKMAKIVRKFVSGISRPMDNLICYTPLYIPYPKSRVVQKINSWIISAQIRTLQWRYKFVKPYYLYFVPTGVILTGMLGQRLSAYYIVDNFSAFDGIEHDAILELEQRSLRSADLVFATAQTIIERFRSERKDIIFSPHGVDVDHFRKTQGPRIAISEEIQKSGPIIGFMGSLVHDSVDLKLIERLAAKRPDWTFLLLGRQSSDVSALKAQRNVLLIPSKPYEELPGWLQLFDVGLMPFLVNDLTRDLNPIKLREYLASGIPVVSTPLPAVQDYKDVVTFALTDEEWLAAISAYLQNPGSPEERQRRVENETWNYRAKTVAQALLSAGEKTAG